jgi:hypothetical protein
MFCKVIVIHNLRNLRIKNYSVTWFSQVFLSPKLQKIEELVWEWSLIYIPGFMKVSWFKRFYWVIHIDT